MKNITILILIGIVVLGVGGFVFASSGKITINENDSAQLIEQPSNNEAQQITLSTKNYNYYPNTIKVKAEQPVSISLDSSVSGCLRSFTIKELGISKYLKNVNDVLVFTPVKKGTFKFSCSMGMGYGTLIVE